MVDSPKPEEDTRSISGDFLIAVDGYINDGKDYEKRYMTGARGIKHVVQYGDDPNRTKVTYTHSLYDSYINQPVEKVREVLKKRGVLITFDNC